MGKSEGPRGHPLVSVILTYYDHAEYLPETLQSLGVQTFTDFEVILVDDRGKSNRSSSLTIWDRTFPVKLLENETNLGLPSSRNAGADLSSGHYLVFLDSDDCLDPLFLEETLKAVIEQNADGIYTLVQLFGDSTYLWEPECTLINLLSGLPGPATFLMKRDVFEQCRGFKPHLLYNCDHEFWISAVAQGFQFKRLDKPLYRYRKHPQSLSTIRKDEWWQAIPRLIEEHRDLYAQHFGEILTAKEMQYREIESRHLILYEHIYAQWKDADRRCTELNAKYTALCASPYFRAYQLMLEGKQKIKQLLSPGKSVRRPSSQ